MEKLSLERFLNNFEAQFEEVEPGSLNGETEFRQLAEWTSMQSLMVIASFDWEYGVTISGEELQGARLIADLYHLVKGKME